MTDPRWKQMINFLVGLGIDKVAHTEHTFLSHLIAVYRLMEAEGCTQELCRAGMFHSIYGTEKFQSFSLLTERRGEVRELIGERAERLGYLNCAMDRPSFDRALERGTAPFQFTDRITGPEVTLDQADFDDLCHVHVFDWIEQVPRSRYGWDYRRSAYRRMAERLGGTVLATYERVFAEEPRPETVTRAVV